MALGQVGMLTFAISITGAIAFVLGIIAENKKPANGSATQQGALFTCVYPTDPYVPLGALAVILLAATTVFGIVSIFFSYNNRSVPVAALAKSKMLVVFGIISSILFFVSEGLLLWAIITENWHRTHNVHTVAHCPTAKTGLMGGAAFLALDTTLFWLLCQMLTMNARADYFDLDEEDEKGSYGYAPEYAAVSAQPANKA